MTEELYRHEITAALNLTAAKQKQQENDTKLFNCFFLFIQNDRRTVPT